MSTDSTQSESPDKKKKKGLFGKLKSLKKSKSIEDSTTGDFVLNAGLQAGSIGGSGSDISVDVSTSGTGKKDMKDRIAGMFKKGTTSRGSSVERSSMDRDVPASAVTERAESLQKPVKTTGLSKPSPVAQKSDSGQTSSASRPLAPTVAQQKPTLNQKPTTTASASTPRRFIR
ncbi:hypothetical protein B566_EDAN016467 [Ephemera danica]|nr:hypothetical protein B566_EDAN016467 [Ephemera danica]